MLQINTLVSYSLQLGHAPKITYSTSISVHQSIDNISILMVKSAINSVNRVPIYFFLPIYFSTY